MKSSPSRTRQWWALLLLGIITAFGSTLFFWQRGSITAASQSLEQRLEGEEEEEEENEDRPDLALEQDVARTMDLALGTVPRERLLVAQEYAEQLVAQRANQRVPPGSLAETRWVERGPNNVGGRIRALVVDPGDATGNTVWAGTAGGGLWKTTNGAATTPTWQSVDNFFSNLAVTAIAFNPANPNIMYFGTGEGYYNADAVRGLGIWKSVDHGATWTQLSSTARSSIFQYVLKLVVHPVTGDVYAATRGGLMRSTNGGTSWEKVLGAGTAGAATDRAADIEIGADNTIYVGMGVQSTDALYRSTTGNLGSWTNLNTLAGSGLPVADYERIELACAPSDAKRVYAMFQGTNDALLNIYRSNDGGTTWTALNKPRWENSDDFTRGQAWYDLSIGVSPSNANQIYIGGVDLFRTLDASASPVVWQQTSYWSTSRNSSQYVHADQHAVAFGSADGNMAYFGCDGGVSLTMNAFGTTNPAFRLRNNGLNVTQFYAVAIHPTLPNYFLAGAQDNGSQKFTAAGVNTTTEASGGDGAFCFIDENEPQFQFTSYVYSNYYRSSNSGVSFPRTITNNDGAFINPTDYDSKRNTMYAASKTGTLFVWPNATTANVTQTITLPSTAGMVTHVTVSKMVDDRVFVGTNTGRVLRIDNALAVAPATPVITEVRAGSGSVSCVALEEGNENHMLVTYSNYGLVSVWESLNGGTTWRTTEGNLPDMPVRWAMFDPTNNKRALLATELGVWGCDDLTSTDVAWQPINNGLANVRVDMLRMRSSDKQIVAATHGRGLYTTDVFVALANKGAVAVNNKFIGSVYPNPFVQNLNVELSQPATSGTTVSLTDMQGRVVYKTDVKSAERLLKLNTPGSLSAGVYTLTVRDAKQTATRQVVVQK
ncbi:T9SS type A sorting domain-containing protein [Hymenobacter metallicola]|uniref:T9SS type A sorting domain-containing protein n=1 Tax=Hymenobacter metallicola TaxID=2563114 RepID=A0A4Z0Q9T4_9BACT|nr:T9SS type A sorting domain-containing protein [Hymenobacter metallicola]TGE26485.1 T9SS type A sorting domain-containing protein [Hymenobacter metallicola]